MKHTMRYGSSGSPLKLKRLKAVLAVITAVLTVVSSLPALAVQSSANVYAASAQANMYYNAVSDDQPEDGEYIIYNKNSGTVMTDTLKENNSFPSYSTGRLGKTVSAENIPSEYRYKLTRTGNGYYIRNASGHYLDIVNYGVLQFTDTPCTLTIQRVTNSSGTTGYTFRKTVDGRDLCISMYASDWYTVHDYSSGVHQIHSLMKYSSEQITEPDVSIREMYSINNYDEKREFQPKRNGDVRNDSLNKLKMYFGMSNREPTFIWGTPGEKLKVYVKAEDDDPLPSLIFTQNISNYYEKAEISLKNGINEITVPAINPTQEGYFQKVEQGGCIYINNPYTENQQSSSFRIYIEGGDIVPHFQKYGNVKSFIKELRDYYSHYKNGEKGYHNVGEIYSQHTVMTLTLERLYEAFVIEGLDPRNSADKWDSFIEYMASIDGLEADEYKNLFVHVRVNQKDPSSNAAAFAWLEMIGVFDDNWSAAALCGRFGWGFAHEFGHVLDVQEKLQPETTNNVFSLRYILENKLYSELAIPKRISDVNSLSTGNVTDIWLRSNEDRTHFWGVYMLWDLEVYYPNFNAMLDDMYRNGTSGDSALDAILANCKTDEKMAIYSSKIIGKDVTDYFTRYGALNNKTSAYQNAVDYLNLPKDLPKIWYYDTDAYIKPKSSNINNHSWVGLSNYDSASKTMYFGLSRSLADNHLGFEITQNGKFIGFVWDNQYTNASLSGTYTVNAYDRTLSVYRTFTVNTNDSSAKDQDAASVNGVGYYTLEQAIAAAQDNSTVVLNKTSAISDTITISGKNITIVPADESTGIYIYNNVPSNKNVFSLTNGASLTVTTNSGGTNGIVFDSADHYCYSYFSVLSGSTLTLGKGVTVRRCSSAVSGSAVSANNSSKVFLRGCLIERCNSNNVGTITLLGGSSLESTNGTIIRYNYSSPGGSAIACPSGTESVYLKDTSIVNNYSSQEAASTVMMTGGTIIVDDGTIIKDNVSDFYMVRTAMKISSSTNAVFKGRIDISDKVSVSCPVKLDLSVGSFITLRAESGYVGEGAVLAVPYSGSFGSSISQQVVYSHNVYNMLYGPDKLYLSETIPLENLSTALPSGTAAVVGSSITMMGNAANGSGDYKYAYYYKTDGVSEWIPIGEEFGEDTVRVMQTETAGNYTFRVIVRDSDGSTASKDFEYKITAAAALKNSSAISSTSVNAGIAVKITGKASGGASPYKFAFYYKTPGASSWTTIGTAYGTATTASYTPKNAGTYSFRATVKDADNNTASKTFTVTVSEASSNELQNTSTISSTTVEQGYPVTLKGSAKGGAGSYKYWFCYKKSTETEYTIIGQPYDGSTSATFYPPVAGTYNVIVRVKDAKDKVSKTGFTVKSTATTSTLTNKSSISSDSITLGGSFKLTAASTGGSGTKKYAFYFRRASNQLWKVIGTEFGTASTAKIVPTAAANFEFKVLIKDGTGRAVTKSFKAVCKNPAVSALKNNSVISSDTISKGETLKLTGKASGGTSPYSYSFYYKKSDESSWQAIGKAYDGTATASFKPTSVSSYDIRIVVKDSTGKTAAKVFSVIVL